MLAYSLNKQITLEKIVNDLQKFISSKSNQDLKDHVLIIKLEKINDYGGDSLLPKITYEPNLSHPI